MNAGPVSFTHNLEELGKSILAYAEVYTKKDLPEILEDQANKLSCSAFSPETQGLFQESALTAPSENSLRGIPLATNWHVRRRKDKAGNTRPVFTESYELLTYKRDSKRGRKGEYRLDRRGRIRHRVVGVRGEIDVRIAARKFQAAGWLSARLAKYGGRAAASESGQKMDRAAVELVLTGDVLSVSIKNTSPAALEVAERTGYLVRAVVNRKTDLDEYTNRKLRERADELNRTRLPSPR